MAAKGGCAVLVVVASLGRGTAPKEDLRLASRPLTVTIAVILLVLLSLGNLQTPLNPGALRRPPSTCSLL